MITSSKPRATLNSKISAALIAPTLLAVSLTIAGALVFGWLNFRNTIERTREDLQSKSTQVARRISAELLIGRRGQPYIVATTLRSELDVENIDILPKSSLPCFPVGNDDKCVSMEERRLSVVTKIPSETEVFAVLSKAVPDFRESIPIGFLFLAGIPVFLVIGIASYLQQRQLRRYFLKPIQSIISKSIVGDEIPDHWPTEFVQLHFDIDEAFKRRDQALIGQLTSGIIHDFKTLLQPIVGATQLSKISTDTERKNKNLDRLLQACERNLPRMQNMLEAVLDGNRDIRLQLRDDDLNETVLNAIRNAQEASDPAKLVSIRTNLPSTPVLIQHDRSQLERALTNLVKNGIEASAANSQSRSLQITLADDTEKATICVEDSGKGFVQPLKTLIEARSTTKLRGTGLGLFVSDKIISAHRGVLSSDNAEVLGGAKIVVTLSKGASA